MLSASKKLPASNPTLKRQAPAHPTTDDDEAMALRLALEENGEFQWDPNPTDADYALALSLSGQPEEEREEDSDTAIARVAQANEDDNRSAESLSTPCYKLTGSFGDDNTVIIEGVLYREQECGSFHGMHSSLCFYMAFCAGNGALAVDTKMRVAPTANSIQARLRPDNAVRFDGPSTMADMEVFMATVQVEHTPICVANREAGTILVYTNSAVTKPVVRLHLRRGHFTLLLPA